MTQQKYQARPASAVTQATIEVYIAHRDRHAQLVADVDQYVDRIEEVLCYLSGLVQS